MAGILVLSGVSLASIFPAFRALAEERMHDLPVSIAINVVALISLTKVAVKPNSAV